MKDDDLTSTNIVVDLPPADTFPLMKLPVELRCHVYSYLFPDRQVLSRPRQQCPCRKFTLRSDGEPCHMAILRANLFIHEEASDYLYSCVPYDIEVSSRAVIFCFREVATLKPPPFESIIRLMRNVNLTIHMVSPKDY